MRVKCRQFEGRLIDLSATEGIERGANGGAFYALAWYNVSIRLDTGEKVEIERVKPTEIEVINAKTAD